MNWDGLAVIAAIWFAGYFFNKWANTPVPKTAEQIQREELEQRKRDQELDAQIEQTRIIKERQREEWQAAYKEYLKSDKWKRTRKRVLKRADNKCEYCGAPATQVHHEKYPKSFSRLEFKGEKLSKLKAICGKCHMERHDIV